MRETLKVINEMKGKGLINDYAIGGGIAALFYIEPFLTYDLDVFIIPGEKRNNKGLIFLSAVFDYLKSMGYTWKGEHIIIEGVPVQFIPADELEKEAVENARVIEYKIITRKKLYEDKAYFHKEQARLPFEEKIKILVKLQEIASRIKGSDKIIWKI